MDRVKKWFENESFKSKTLPNVVKFRSIHPTDDIKGLQIWPPTYQPSWYYYKQHQANHWYATEHDPMDDLKGFNQIDLGWQNALLQSFAVLAMGDDRVMDLIKDSNVEWEESTKWLFADIGARETTHKIVYNRMLELAHGSKSMTVNLLTSDEYAGYMMLNCDRLNKLTTPRNDKIYDKVVFLINLILCERYLFAAPFLIINLMGESGLLNTCVRINMQTMKDEHVHYLHALNLFNDLKGCENTIERIWPAITSVFREIVESMIMKICIDLDDKIKRGIMDHTRFTLRAIHEDVKIEPPADLQKYVRTPFSVFEKNTGVDKFNLMEINSTVYKASRSIYVPDVDKIKGIIEKEEEVNE